MTNRRGDWQQTYSGGVFWPCDPRPEDIDIRDIAHALSLQCRFAGHCRTFYSVAQHSVMVSHLLPRAVALAGLLHDAAEAFVVDVPRPIKRMPGMEALRDAEDRVLECIMAACGVAWTPEIHAAVKHADNVMLATEARRLMVWPPPRAWERLPVDTDDQWICEYTSNPWPSSRAEVEFLARFNALRGGVA